MVLHRGGGASRRVAKIVAITVSDLDIHRTAKLLIDRHGVQPPTRPNVKQDAGRKFP